MNLHIALILFLCEFWANVAVNCSADAPKSKACQLPIMSMIPCFEELSKCTSYIDKTLFIEEFFKWSGPRQFHLITYPPKYGKTANLNMMQRFLHIDAEDDLFIGHDLFNSSHLKITPILNRGDARLRYHYKNQKCIYISFKDSTGKISENPLLGLRESLARCYNQFKYERFYFKMKHNLTQERIYEHVGNMMDVVMDTKEPMDEYLIIHGLLALVSVMVEFDKNITLLIDDYDEPIRNAIENNFDVIQATNVIEKFFSTLFVTPHASLRYAIITGTLNILDESRFSNVRPWNFLDGDSIFTPYFGFTADEVDHLLDKHYVQSNIKNLVKHYTGYNTSKPTRQIYNPYSIVQNLCTGNLNKPRELDDHWIKVVSSRIPNFLRSIQNNEKFREIIAQLLASDKITFNLITHWSPKDLEELRKITHNKTCELTVRRVNLILSYLFHNGYISHADQPRTYCVPNEEIRAALNQTCPQSKLKKKLKFLKQH